MKPTPFDPVSIMGSKVVENSGPGFQPGSCWYQTKDGVFYKILASGIIRSSKDDTITYYSPDALLVRYTNGEDLFT